MEDLLMDNVETAAAELRKTAEYYDGVAGKWLANLTTEQYAERLKGICKPGEGELRLHRQAITQLPPYIVTALREGDARTLQAFRTRSSAEHMHSDVEAWYHFQGGRYAVSNLHTSY